MSGENGATEIFTDEKGYACSIPLPFGSYIVRETTTPHNYKPVDDFEVNITEHHPNEPQIWRVLLDEEFKAKLKIVKKDDETKKSVLIAGTEFKVYDLGQQKVRGTGNNLPSDNHSQVLFYGQSGISDHAEESEDRTLPD